MISHDTVLRSKVGRSQRATVDRIMAHYRRATEEDILAGKAWYAEASSFADELSAQGDITREQAAAVIAHLSPRMPWERNKLEARSLVLTGQAKALGACIARANAAMISDEPLATFGGPKTRAFAANIAGDESAVTVDVWASRVAGVDEKELGRVGVYEAVAHCYRLAAKRVGISPTAMQAITWVVLRGSAA